MQHMMRLRLLLLAVAVVLATAAAIIVLWQIATPVPESFERILN